MRTRKREALPFTVEVHKQRIAKGEKDFREREKNNCRVSGKMHADSG